jgi:hypothetical protein
LAPTAGCGSGWTGEFAATALGGLVRARSSLGAGFWTHLFQVVEAGSEDRIPGIQHFRILLTREIVPSHNQFLFADSERIRSSRHSGFTVGLNHWQLHPLSIHPLSVLVTVANEDLA